MDKLSKNKKYILLGIVFVFIVSCIAIFVFSKSYALEGFGQIDLSCDKTLASGGENIQCIVTGTVASTSQVSSLSSKIKLSENLEFVSFTTDSIWEGIGDDGIIELYTDENKSSTFAIGSFTVKVKEGTVNTTETIQLSENYFYDHLFEEQTIQDTSLDIKTPQFKSDIYDMSNDYIIVNTKDINTILSSITTEGCNSKINLNGQEVETGTIDESAKLEIINGENILKEFTIIYMNSNKYDLSKEYIIESNADSSKVIENIEVMNGTLSIKNEQLVLSYNNTGIKSYDLLTITSSSYLVNLNKNYLVIDEEITDTILNQITTSSNVSISIENNNLNINYKESTIKTLSIINISSEQYDINLIDKYIYIGTESITEDITNNISTNASLSVEENQLNIYMNNEIILKLAMINIKSSKYTIDTKNHYIYSKNTNELAELNKNITVTNATLTIENNLLNIVYQDKKIRQFTLYYLSSSENEITNTNIYIREDMEYNNFIQNIIGNGLSYKFYNQEGVEITSGTITDNYSMKVYLESTLLDTYIIKLEYLDMKDISLKEEEKLIHHIGLNTTYHDIMENISTSGTVEFYDKNNNKLELTNRMKSYSIVKIKLSSKTVEYQISVLGDVTGTGTVTAGDIAKMYQSVKGKITLDNVALLAGDVTQDGKVAVNDVAKAYAYLKGKLTSLE